MLSVVIPGPATAELDRQAIHEDAALLEQRFRLADQVDVLDLTGAEADG